MRALAERGVTPVLLAVNGKPAALFAIRDPLREDSVAALQRLHQQGYQLVMLTGDNPVTANAIAKEAGIDRVIAGVLPDGKAAAIAAAGAGPARGDGRRRHQRRPGAGAGRRGHRDGRRQRHRHRDRRH